MDKKIYIGLDRDGVINEDIGTYVVDPKQFKPIPGSLEAIKNFKDLGYGVVILTNQAGIGKFIFDEYQLDRVHRHMDFLLKEKGCQEIDGLCYSQSAWEGDNFRKPNIGMFLQAERDFNVSWVDGYYVGDKITDLQFAINYNVKPVLVQTGYGKITEQRINEKPEYAHIKEKLEGRIFKDLAHFQGWIQLKHVPKGPKNPKPIPKEAEQESAKP
jgi:D-glycero-D-manno-heptose 1,7-bisphosphate phosphatase